MTLRKITQNFCKDSWLQLKCKPMNCLILSRNANYYTMTFSLMVKMGIISILHQIMFMQDGLEIMHQNYHYKQASKHHLEKLRARIE